jgi:hypothetical protein
VAHVWDSSYSGGRYQEDFSLRLARAKKVERPLSQQISQAWWQASVIPAMLGINKTLACSKSMRPYLKYKKPKGAGGGVQVVECLSSKSESLSSKPGTTNKQTNTFYTDY